MRKVIRKWFWAWSFDKEEKWLNEMAAKGLALVAVGFCKYTFEECTPGEYKVRLELLEEVPVHAESQQYINFLEDTGAQYLGSVIRWSYFRKKVNDGEFELYSDNASRIVHLNRIQTLIGIVGGLNILAGVNSISRYYETGWNGSFMGIINLCIGLFVACGFLRVFIKRRKLLMLQNLFE